MRGLTTLIFDMDGTLIDSKPGLLRCLAETFRRMGTPLPSEERLLQFIGPPFQDAIKAYCDYTDAMALQAREIFCALYEQGGLTEVEPVKGVHAMLRALRAHGFRTAVASSKLESFCRVQLESLQLDGLMDAVAGSQASGDLREYKSDLIADALHMLGIAEDRWSREACMIGDRRFDMEGARTLGLRCIGFSPCGYAADEELWEAGACAVFHTAQELQAYLLEQTGRGEA